MIPKKPKDLYKELSEEMGISNELIEDLMEFYYKEIKDNMSNLKHLRIHVDGLGQFVIKEAYVRKCIPKFRQKLTTHDTSTFNAYHNKLTLEKKLIALEIIEKQLAQVDIKKQEVALKKQEYNNKKINHEKHTETNLGEQEPNN